MESRGRVVWAQMWRIIARHFAAIGASTGSESGAGGVTSEVALYAVDSLRPLSVKFLERDAADDDSAEGVPGRRRSRRCRWT